MTNRFFYHDPRKTNLPQKSTNQPQQNSVYVVDFCLVIFFIYIRSLFNCYRLCAYIRLLISDQCFKYCIIVIWNSDISCYGRVHY